MSDRGMRSSSAEVQSRRKQSTVLFIRGTTAYSPMKGMCAHELSELSDGRLDLCDMNFESDGIHSAAYHAFAVESKRS